MTVNQRWGDSSLIYSSFCEFLLKKMTTTLPTCVIPTAGETVIFHQPPTNTTNTSWAPRFNLVEGNQFPAPRSAKSVSLFYSFSLSGMPSFPSYQHVRTLLSLTHPLGSRFVGFKTDQSGKKAKWMLSLSTHILKMYLFTCLLPDSKTKYNPLTVWQIAVRDNGDALNANLIRMELKS